MGFQFRKLISNLKVETHVFSSLARGSPHLRGSHPHRRVCVRSQGTHHEADGSSQSPGFSISTGPGVPPGCPARAATSAEGGGTDRVRWRNKGKPPLYVFERTDTKMS